MQPTMKLRYVQSGWTQVGPLMIGGQSNRRPVYMLQQWYEHTVSIPIDGVVTEQVVGEWCDVPIEVEA